MQDEAWMSDDSAIPSGPTGRCDGMCRVRGRNEWRTVRTEGGDVGTKPSGARLGSTNYSFVTQSEALFRADPKD